MLERLRRFLRGPGRKGAIRRELLDATVRSVKEGWVDQEFIDNVMLEVGTTPVRRILEASGFVVAADGTVLQKPGLCEVCGGYDLLRRGIYDGRWLCTECWTEDMCSTAG